MNKIKNETFTVFNLESFDAEVALSGCDDRSYLFVADMREFFRSPVSTGQELNYTSFEQAIHALGRNPLIKFTHSKARLYYFISDEGM